jgi:sorbitol-specific phosphotransferase system component IIBC
MPKSSQYITIIAGKFDYIFGNFHPEKQTILLTNIVPFMKFVCIVICAVFNFFDVYFIVDI